MAETGGDEPGAVGRLKGEAQPGEDQIAQEEAHQEGEGAPRAKRGRARSGHPATFRLARPKRRKAKGKVA